MSKEKPVSDALKVLLDISMNFFRNQILRRIELDEEYQRRGVEVAFMPLGDVVKVLNDNDPNNKEQLKGIFLLWVNGPLADFVEDLFASLIEKNEDENIKKVLTFLSQNAVTVMRVFTDSDEKNNEQLKALFNTIIDNPEVHDMILDNVLRPVLTKTIKDAQWIEYVLELLRSALNNLDMLKATKAAYEPAAE